MARSQAIMFKIVFSCVNVEDADGPWPPSPVPELTYCRVLPGQCGDYKE